MTPALLLASLLVVADRPEIVVADFEGDDYGAWTAEGAAFGDAPARGTLPGQMEVTGFLGRGLVNSFRGGDAATGRLTSPEFTIERPFLNFLIGGGAHPGKTALELLVGGAVVRTATGPNDSPGGSERLDWHDWDVSDLMGKPAVLRVVDDATGGWGHINVDQIVQSDARRGPVDARRTLRADRRYLLIPVDRASPTRRVRVAGASGVAAEFEARLALGTPDFWVFLDLGPRRGEEVEITARLPAGSEALGALRTSDDPVPDPATLYEEPGRPRFHFTSRRGWLNDPNGLVFFEGEYHLFYQHNPYGWDWGNMHWGHAVSPDLVRWTELPIALAPRAFGDWAFSGSAVVDAGDTSGFGTGGRPPLVAAFTSTGRGECIAYSDDRGRTWREYEGNPVVRHEGRDPRLLRHGPTGRWVMAVYDETGGARDIAFYTSADLKSWSFASKIPGFFECPDLFELPIEGAGGASRWVLHAADGAYLLGDFDGERFTPDSPEKRRLWYGDFYAAQTFSDAPDGRRVQVGWGRDVTFPGMPFNQQMTVPCALTLRPTPEGPRLHAEPVAELATLAAETRAWKDVALDDGPGPLARLDGDALDLDLEIRLGGATTVTLDVRGTAVAYDAARGVLSAGRHSAPRGAAGDTLRLRVLIDRGSIEVFGDSGRVAISTAFRPDPGRRGLALSAAGGPAVATIRASLLRSAWSDRGPGPAVP